MSLIDSMQTLKDEIKVSHGRRRQDLKNIRRDTKQVQQDSQRTISDFEKIRKEKAENLAQELTSFTKDLTENVDTLRKNFRQDQADVRKEVLTASKLWHGKVSATKDESGDNEGEKD